MKAIITGSEGFVGKYLKNELETNGYSVFGFDVVSGDNNIIVDLLNKDELKEKIVSVNPDIIFHLAGQANVGLSWTIPQKTFELNVIAALNIMEVVKDYNSKIKIVIVGSSDEYGNLKERGINVTEDLELIPNNPYSISKKAQEELGRLYVNNYNMNICMTRSFNHAGKGQKQGFLISDFASGIVKVEKGIEPFVKVGNLQSKRDFTHVKDIVRAYRLIGEKGMSGEIYNVGSGNAYEIQWILDEMIKLAKCDIKVEIDKNRLRPSDTPVICCNHDKLTNDTGWNPKIAINEILYEVLDEWRNKV